MKQYSSKNKEVLSKKDVDFKSNLDKLATYAQGGSMGAFTGGVPETKAYNDLVQNIVSTASKDVHNIYHDHTRSKQERVRMASMVEKDTTKRLHAVSEAIFKQITTNNDTVDAAYRDIEAYGSTSNHPRSQAIRSRLQNMKYADLKVALESDQGVAQVFMSDPAMIYDLDDKQQKALRSSLLGKFKPDAARALASHDNLFTGYESLLTNTQKLSNMMVDKEELEKVDAMRVKSPEGRFTSSGDSAFKYGSSEGSEGSAAQFGGTSPGFKHLPGWGNA